MLDQLLPTFLRLKNALRVVVGEQDIRATGNVACDYRSDVNSNRSFAELQDLHKHWLHSLIVE